MLDTCNAEKWIQRSTLEQVHLVSLSRTTCLYSPRQGAFLPPGYCCARKLHLCHHRRARSHNGETATAIRSRRTAVQEFGMKSSCGKGIRFAEEPATSTIRPQLQAPFLSASRSGRLDLPVQMMSLRCWLTGKLTGKPLDNIRFSANPVDTELGKRAGNRQPQTSVDGECRRGDSARCMCQWFCSTRSCAIQYFSCSSCAVISVYTSTRLAIPPLKTILTDFRSNMQPCDSCMSVLNEHLLFRS
jgi:hypothetical protein